jgi:hypothetical protein
LNIYLVIKVGIYNHDIFGSFEIKDVAIEKATMLSKMENDGYHSFEVVEMGLDSLQPAKAKEFYGLSCEQNTVFSIRKELLGEEIDEDDYDWHLNLLDFG